MYKYVIPVFLFEYKLLIVQLLISASVRFHCDLFSIKYESIIFFTMTEFIFGEADFWANEIAGNTKKQSSLRNFIMDLY